MEYQPQFVPGIDISYWNTFGLDQTGVEGMFVSALARNVQWFMFRAGKGGTETGIGPNGQDLKLQTVTDAAVGLGLPCLSFWRVYDILNEDPVDQADKAAAAFDVARTATFKSPVMIDVEELWTASPVDVSDIGGIVRFWLSEFRYSLARNGYTNTIVYTRKSWWDPYVNLDWSGDPLHVAHWIRNEVPENASSWEHWAWLNMPNGPALPMAWEVADVWQFASAGGGYGTKIGASSEDVDCNLMSGWLYQRIFG